MLVQSTECDAIHCVIHLTQRVHGGGTYMAATLPTLQW